MQKIIFFDIDGTLFDVSSFLNLLHQKLIDQLGMTSQDISKLKIIYDEVKRENGYFFPTSFLTKIVSNFQLVDKTRLEKIFWGIDLFEKSLYKDTLAVGDLAKLAKIGIFSKGEVEFQKKKLSFLNISIDDQDIYIFPNKVDKIREIFGKYENYEVYLVDDNLEVLREVKNLTSVNLVLIDRNNHYNGTDIKTITDLNELKRIL